MTGVLMGQSLTPLEAAASQELGVSGGNISSVLKRRFRQTGGFVFRYPDEDFTEEDKVTRRAQHKSKAIVAYHISDSRRKVFDTPSHAAREFFGKDNVNRSGSIRKSALSPSDWKRTVCGFYFFFLGEEPEGEITFARRGRQAASDD